jgi:hypothetical protein
MRMRSVSVCLLVLAFALSCGGSDSDGEGGMCSEDASCGGKLEGSWKLADACYTVLEQPDYPGCTGVTAELSAMADGNVTFEKDSYDRHMQVDLTLTFNFPAKCKEDKKRECKDFEGTLGSGATLACKDADGGCKCTADQPSTTNDSGGYTIRGNKVELVGDTFDYCVKGNRLTLKPTRPARMSGSEATSEVQFSFDKN